MERPTTKSGMRTGSGRGRLRCAIALLALLAGTLSFAAPADAATSVYYDLQHNLIVAGDQYDNNIEVYEGSVQRNDGTVSDVPVVYRNVLLPILKKGTKTTVVSELPAVREAAVKTIILLLKSGELVAAGKYVAVAAGKIATTVGPIAGPITGVIEVLDAIQEFTYPDDFTYETDRKIMVVDKNVSPNSKGGMAPTYPCDYRRIQNTWKQDFSTVECPLVSDTRPDLTVLGNDGMDTITFNLTEEWLGKLIMDGGDKNDTLRGSQWDDIAIGGLGRDRLYLYGGQDWAMIDGDQEVDTADGGFEPRECDTDQRSCNLADVGWEDLGGASAGAGGAAGTGSGGTVVNFSDIAFPKLPEELSP